MLNYSTFKSALKKNLQHYVNLDTGNKQNMSPMPF